MTTEPTKVCAGPCGQRLPWSDFHAKVKWEDGTTRQPHAYCKDCQKAYSRGWHNRRWRSDPEWRKRRQTAKYEAERSNPERWAARLEYQREWARNRYGYHVVKSARHRASGGPGGTVLDPAPFAAWLRTLGTTSQIAGATGISESQVRKYLAGSQDVFFDTVDRACLHADASLDDIYPLENAA